MFRCNNAFHFVFKFHFAKHNLSQRTPTLPDPYFAKKINQKNRTISQSYILVRINEGLNEHYC